MEPAAQTTEEINNGGGGESNAGFLASCRDRLRSASDGLGRAVAGLAGKLARIARDDPRRVAHSLKVGLALTLVSLFYFVTPLYNGWGDSTLHHLGRHHRRLRHGVHRRYVRSRTWTCSSIT